MLSVSAEAVSPGSEALIMSGVVKLLLALKEQEVGRAKPGQVAQLDGQQA